MSGDFADRLALGLLGERLGDEFLRQKGWILYRPDRGSPHPFDRLAASPDKTRMCIVEYKTKCRREAYADTGINRRHFNEYMDVTTTYEVPLFLAFIDAKARQMYGNWWAELIKSREPDLHAWAGGCQSYPWDHRGIVYFPIAAMRVIAVLSDADCADILAKRETRWIEQGGD